MIDAYLKRGVLAGTVAGIGYGLFMAFVANPLSEYLHGLQHDGGHGHDHGHDGAHGHDHSHVDGGAHVVSEATNAIVSVASGLLWAIFLGGMFALSLYFLEPALPGGDTVRTYLLAGAGFLSVSVTPWLVLPPATPGAEQLYGIEPRLAIYSGLVVLGIGISATAVVSYKRVAVRRHRLGLLAAAIPIVSALIVIPLLTPTVVSHPGLPADLVSAYQAMVVLSQAAVWALIAGTYNWQTRRASVSSVTADGLTNTQSETT